MANEKILVVDDDTNICELLRLYLTKEGCRCSGWLILPLGPVFQLRFLVEECFGYRMGLSMFWFSWIPCFSA